MPVVHPSSLSVGQTPSRLDRPSDRPYVALGVANGGGSPVVVRIGPDTWPIGAGAQTVIPLPLDQVPVTVGAVPTASSQSLAAPAPSAIVSATWYLPDDMTATTSVGSSLAQVQAGSIAGPAQIYTQNVGSIATAGTAQPANDANPFSSTTLVALFNTGSDSLEWFFSVLSYNETPPTPLPVITQPSGSPPIVIPFPGVSQLNTWVTSSTAGATFGYLACGTI